MPAHFHDSIRNLIGFRPCWIGTNKWVLPEILLQPEPNGKGDWIFSIFLGGFRRDLRKVPLVSIPALLESWEHDPEGFIKTWWGAVPPGEGPAAPSPSAKSLDDMGL